MCSDFFSKKEKEKPVCFANVDTVVVNRKNFFKKLSLCKKKEALLDVFPGQSSSYSFIRPKNEKNVSEVVDYKTISSLACSGLYGFGSYKEMKEKADYSLKQNINANFFIPKPNKKNILSSKKLGGGVIMDMGPYIAAVSRLFFKSNPKKKIKKVIFVNKIASKIEIKFTYRGSYFVGKFSHNDKYKNSMEICFNKKVVKL